MAQWVPRWIVVHLTQVRFLVNSWFQFGKSVDGITYKNAEKQLIIGHKDGVGVRILDSFSSLETGSRL